MSTSRLYISKLYVILGLLQKVQSFETLVKTHFIFVALRVILKRVQYIYSYKMHVQVKSFFRLFHLFTRPSYTAWAPVTPIMSVKAGKAWHATRQERCVRAMLTLDCRVMAHAFVWQTVTLSPWLELHFIFFIL